MGFHCVTISRARWWRLGEPAAPGRNSRSGRNNSSLRGINYFPLNWTRPQSPPTALLRDRPLDQGLAVPAKGWRQPGKISRCG